MVAFLTVLVLMGQGTLHASVLKPHLPINLSPLGELLSLGWGGGSLLEV